MSRTSVFSKKARASDDDLSEEKSVSYVKKMEDQFKIFDPENKGFTPAMMVEILTRNHGFSQGDAEEFTEDIFDVSVFPLSCLLSAERRMHCWMWRPRYAVWLMWIGDALVADACPRLRLARSLAALRHRTERRDHDLRRVQEGMDGDQGPHGHMTGHQATRTVLRLRADDAKQEGPSKSGSGEPLNSRLGSRRENQQNRAERTHRDSL